MRTQDIQVKLESREERELTDRLSTCSEVVCIRDCFVPLVVGRVLDIVVVDDTILATVEFTMSDRVLARMLNTLRSAVDSFLDTAEYSLAIDRYTHKLAISVQPYEPDELDMWDFDDEGWPT